MGRSKQYVKLVFSSANSGKLMEFERILRGRGMAVEISTPKELGIEHEIIETGEKFEENARLKALEVFNLIDRHNNLGCESNSENGNRIFSIVVAEDSGLEIPLLGNWPGVLSKRIGSTDKERIDILLKAIRDKKQLTDLNCGESDYFECPARFVCCAAAVQNGEVVFETRGEVEGTVISEPAGDNGFGYDPVFYYPPLAMTFAQMTTEKKSEVSHRRIALERICSWLIERGLL